MLSRRLLSTAIASLAFAGTSTALAQTAIDLNALNDGDSGDEDVYAVVDGDTLWDLCSQFFNDPQYWPTLWSINNDEVTNPHYIYPGQRLRFKPGTDVRPPSIVVDSGPSDDLAFDDSFTPLVHFTATERDCELYVPFRDTGEEVTLRSPGIMTRQEVEPLGVVDQAVAEKANLGSPDVVYMRFRNTGDVNCGDVYTVYRHVKEARHPEVRSARLGHIYRVAGEVMVSDVGDKWVTGRMVSSHSEVVRGDLITDRLPVSGRIRTSELSSLVDGFIIDKGHDENLLMQSNQVIFIDRGKSDGVQSGTTFYVVRRGDGLARRPRDFDNSLPDKVIGRLVVFSADENVAMAVMTDQATDVKVGDRITSRID